MELKVKISKERAEEIVGEIEKAYNLVNLNALTGFSANEEKEEAMNNAKKLLVQGLMVGLLEFKPETRQIIQNLNEPLVLGEHKADRLNYASKKVKAYHLKTLTGANGGFDELEILESVTGTPKKLLTELSTFDYEMAGSVLTLFLA